MTLRDLWNDNADPWISWARAPGHDSYWRFHRDAFFALLPPPGRRTVDVGCGEGRVTRDLRAKGHKVAGAEPSHKLVAAARAADPGTEYVEAPGHALPFADAYADLVVAFMVLQDVDDLDATVAECARILSRGGRLCIAITHPTNSAGSFADDHSDSVFVIGDSYLDEKQTALTFSRNGLTMTFHSRHRPLEAYSRAIERAGLCIEAIREPPSTEKNMSAKAKRWTRLPLFLHLRCQK